MKEQYSEILDTVKTYLILDEVNSWMIDIVLATVLSLNLDRPVWVMIIAPPSSGKTEIIQLVRGYKDVHFIHQITKKFLFSGHKEADGGFMLKTVKEKGVLIFSDFTTITEKNPYEKKEIFNQLRIIYDGSSSFGTGMDGGQAKVWNGKVAIIINNTESFETTKESSSDLGERFVYYNLMPTKTDTEKIIDFNPIEENKIIANQLTLKYLDESKNEIKSIALSKEEEMKLLTIAEFISKGRAKVERSGDKRLIEYIHQREQPYRVLRVLKNLYISLLTINGDKDRSITILRRIGVSSIAQTRFRVLLTILSGSENTVVNICSRLRLSDTKTRRIIEDLYAQQLLTKTTKQGTKELVYTIEDKFMKECDFVIKGIYHFPEKLV